VAIVMLSDENDCSIQDEGYGWLIARASPMYRSTSQCGANPNDKCCQSCGEKAANDGCPAIASDSECAKGAYLDAGNDDLNLRCWQQKRRFGFDLLYPTARYSDALKSHVVRQRSTGMNVENPLFHASDGKAARDNGLVFLAGIVGVPWQDIANDDSVSGAGLRYLTEAEIEAKGRWAMILGSPSTAGTNDPPIPPTDPFMIEQADERAAGVANPVTMTDKIVASSSTDQQANKINGHEQANMGNRDLQYACTFKLATPLTCDQAAFDANKGCDCFMEDLVYNRSLCEGGTINQTYAKAYPGTRHLQVLKEFKDNSIVASICPKYPSAADKAMNNDYGYNPAVKAIIDRLKEALKGKCLPRPLNPTKEATDTLQVGQVPCKVIEAALPKEGAGCSCDTSANRASIDDKPQLRQAVLDKLKQESTCDVGGTACSSYCTCELLQLAGQDLKDCEQQGKDFAKPGYCYINATPGEPNIGNAQLVKDCSADSKRLIAFTGGTPAPGAIALVACLGASLGSVE